MTSSWFFLSTLNYDARSTTHQIPLIFFYYVDMNNHIFTYCGAWRILICSQEPNTGRLFPRQFSPVHTTYALRLFKVRLIGICYCAEISRGTAFPQRNRQSATCGLCLSEKTGASFSCHFPSPRLNLFSLSFYNESECCEVRFPVVYPSHGYEPCL